MGAGAWVAGGGGGGAGAAVGAGAWVVGTVVATVVGASVEVSSRDGGGPVVDGGAVAVCEPPDEHPAARQKVPRMSTVRVRFTWTPIRERKTGVRAVVAALTPYSLAGWSQQRKYC